jgi:hypothetical protein
MTHNPTSDARQRLAHFANVKREALAEAAEIQARIARLQALASAVSPAESALRSFDSQSAAAMVAWAERADGSPAPEIDANARGELVRRAESARASAAAATSSIQQLSAKLAEASRVAAQAAEAIKIASAIVLLDEMTDHLPDLTAAAQALKDEKLRLAGRRLAVLAVADRAGPGAREIHVALERFDSLARDAGSLPHPVPSDGQGFSAEAFDFLAALSEDPNAGLAK